ncbi:hypothetical protein DFH27DRAFT_497395 [Peziza echinospora]|nr:hypothetical protein DFH27DRAFT_497395 [Peziza echinospora]
MKISLALTSVFLSAFSSVVSAVPTAAAAAADVTTEILPRHHRQGEYYITPAMIIKIKEGEKNHFDVSNQGEVARYNSRGKKYEVRTLIAFNLPQESKNKKCRLFFKKPDWFDGSGKMNIFELSEGFNDAATWYYGRGKVASLYATFTAVWGAQFEEANVKWAKGFGFFDCPHGGTAYYEVAAASKKDTVFWHQEQDPHDTPGFTMAVVEPAYAY